MTNARFRVEAAIVRTMFGHDDRSPIAQRPVRVSRRRQRAGAIWRQNNGFRYLGTSNNGDIFARSIASSAPNRTYSRQIKTKITVALDLSQGLAFVTLLPTRFLAGPFAQTRHPHRFLQPIARRRLAATRTVQSEPTLKFGDLGSQRLNQRNELFPR